MDRVELPDYNPFPSLSHEIRIHYILKKGHNSGTI